MKRIKLKHILEQVSYTLGILTFLFVVACVGGVDRGVTLSFTQFLRNLFWVLPMGAATYIIFRVSKAL